MISFLARMMTVMFVSATVLPMVQTRMQELMQQRLSEALSGPATLQQLLNEDSVDQWPGTNPTLQFAATVHKPKSTIRFPEESKRPLGVRTRIVQAFPVDPSAVPSMVVPSRQRAS